MIASIGRYAGLLRAPDFRRLWLAQSVSQVGTQVTLLALPLVAIVVLGASPFEVAVLGAVESLPFLLFTLLAGAWVDRLPKRRLLIAADLGRAAVLALVPIASVLHLLAIWEVYVVAFVAGTLTVFFDIAYQAILPELVGRSRLAEGNSRLEISRSAAQVVGPGLGGFLVGVLTAPIAILVDAGSYLASAAFLLGIRARPTEAAPASEAPATPDPTSIRGEILEGLRFYRRSPLLLAESAAIVTINLGLTIGGSITLVFLVRDLGLTPEALGLAFSIGAIGLVVGAVTGAAISRRIGVGPALIIGAAGGGLASFGIALASAETAFAILVGATTIQGLALMLVNINGLSLRQALTLDRLQGRVNATGRWINWGVLPIGNVIGGTLATIVGLRETIVIGAVIELASLVWLVLSPLRSLREMPAEPPVE